MVINSFRAFLFIAAGATAAVGTAYVTGALDPYLKAEHVAASTSVVQASPKSERVGEQGAAAEPEKAPQPATATAPAVKPANAPAPATQTAAKAPATETAPAPATQTAAAPSPKAVEEATQPAVIAPSFDIVRVEPDGSIVVAGRAAPDAMVEIVAGANVLGKTKASAGGDFAIALDEQLKPGGHELVLRSTAKDNVVATSPETAVVSIPEEKDGQVLALVEKPGEASKLITVPKPRSVEQTPAVDGKPATTGAEAAAKGAEAPSVPPEPAAAKTEPPAGEQPAGQSVAA